MDAEPLEELSDPDEEQDEKEPVLLSIDDFYDLLMEQQEQM